MVILQNVCYQHPDKTLLFDKLHLRIQAHDKIALVGNNGVGKSTLLKLIAGVLHPASGLVQTSSKPAYIPQVFGQFNELTIAQALGIGEKLTALHQILSGQVTTANLDLLEEDWTVEERCKTAMLRWKLEDFTLSQKMKTLSGGEKTRVFLAGIAILEPPILLLDEPSNHLDASGRQLLYDLVQTFAGTLVVVSHDRKLLNLLDSTVELGTRGITRYGGNYEFYAEQKFLETNALSQEVNTTEKALRKAKETERETVERQQKLDARGRKKQENSGLPTILLNTYKNNAEKSTARAKGIHAEKVGAIARELQELREALPAKDKMQFGFDDAALHRGKVLVTGKAMNIEFDRSLLWKESLSFEIRTGERITIKGLNGSGKTTLVKLILGELEPTYGVIYRATNKSVYIDQDYSLVNDQLSVYEQAQQFNKTGLQEHEVKVRLNRFLFGRDFWKKSCLSLSGGEKMRLMLCCLTIGNQAPDMIILDEPTNNLDLQNIEILTAAINGYRGTLVVVSHDEYFLEQVQVERTIFLE